MTRKKGRNEPSAQARQRPLLKQFTLLVEIPHALTPFVQAQFAVVGVMNKRRREVSPTNSVGRECGRWRCIVCLLLVSLENSNEEGSFEVAILFVPGVER